MFKKKDIYLEKRVSIPYDIIEQFKAIDFLNKSRRVSNKYIIIDNLIKADSLCRSQNWENLNLDKTNDLTQYLSENNKQLYNQQWNEWIKQSKEKVIPFLENKIDALISQEKLTDNIKDDIKFNIVGLINYIMYKRIISNFEFPFLEDLLEIYESGYIPVSYQGEYPKGQFIVI